MKRAGVAAVMGWVMLALGAASAAAGPVPETVGFVARLVEGGQPVSGSHAVGFELFDAASAGASRWTETYASVEVQKGLLFSELGSLETLAGVFDDGAELYLEVTVDGERLAPRLAVASVPYALRAGDADKLGGRSYDEIEKKVLTGETDPSVNALGKAELACGASEVAEFDGAAWVCAANKLTEAEVDAYANNNGYASDASLGPLAKAQLACVAGQSPEHNGATWMCAANKLTEGEVDDRAGGGASRSRGRPHG